MSTSLKVPLWKSHWGNFFQCLIVLIGRTQSFLPPFISKQSLCCSNASFFLVLGPIPGRCENHIIMRQTSISLKAATMFSHRLLLFNCWSSFLKGWGVLSLLIFDSQSGSNSFITPLSNWSLSNFLEHKIKNRACCSSSGLTRTEYRKI